MNTTPNSIGREQATGSMQQDLQLVTLGIDAEVFAVPVAAVIEILDMRPLFRIPRAPAHFAGLIDVRGRSVPVIDLRVKLGLDPAAVTDSTRILVLEVAMAGKVITLGLIADRVFEVLALGAAEVEPTPDIGTRWHTGYIAGVGHRDGQFIVIFDLPRLFSFEDMDLLNTAVDHDAVTH